MGRIIDWIRHQITTPLRLTTTINQIPQDKTFGIDVSHWQGNIDWNKVKSKGVKFAITKINDVGWGTRKPFYDSKSVQNYNSAKEVGILVGGYSWLNPNYDGKLLALHYLDWCQNRPLDIPPILDFEDNNVVNKNDYLYKAQQWLDTVATRTNKKPIIYTRASYLDIFDRSKTAWMGEYSLWVAHYIQRTYPTIPREWDDWDIWQYSEHGHYPYYIHADRNNKYGKSFGVQSYGLDTNWFNGKYDYLLEFCYGENKTPPIIEPPIIPSGYYADVNTGIDRLIVREKPKGKELRRINSGTTVFVSEINDGWAKIDEGQYVMSKFLAPLGEKPLYTAIVSTRYPNRLIVRKAPGGREVDRINSGSEINIWEDNGSWVKIGHNRYVSKAYISRKD